MRQEIYTTRFVDRMPEVLEDGVLYVAPHYEVAMHNCMCGCGEKVCTPLIDGAWNWFFSGKHITILPAIGNFQYRCCSHYFLKDGKVQWC